MATKTDWPATRRLISRLCTFSPQTKPSSEKTTVKIIFQKQPKHRFSVQPVKKQRGGEALAESGSKQNIVPNELSVGLTPASQHRRMRARDSRRKPAVLSELCQVTTDSGELAVSTTSDC